MATFHCEVSHGSRKGGQSGAAKVEYIMRSGRYIGDAGEVIGACSGHLPGWSGGNPRTFFAAADEYERLNGRLFGQVLFAIPNTLSDRDALLLAYFYAEAVTDGRAPYALAVHRGGVEVADWETVSAAPQEADEGGLPPHNRHGHLVICERIDDGIERTAREWFRRANRKEPALGGAAKDRAMNGGNWVPEVRHLCADYINYALERAGLSERVTCESHETRIAHAEAAGDEATAERLRLDPPGVHLGPTAWAIEKGRPGRPGRPSWRGDLNRAIAAEAETLRGQVEVLNAALSQLDVRQAVGNEKLQAARRVAAAQFERREKTLQGTSIGGEILHAVRAEMIGESAAGLSVVRQGEIVEAAEQRFGAAVELREEGFRETSVGSRYLDDATQSILGAGQSPTLPQRELIIRTAEGRLARDLDRREATLCASEAGADVLGAVQLKCADEYGSVLTHVQREQLVDTAERRLAEQEAVLRGELDRREEVLRAIGTQHLAAAIQELFGEGKQAETLADRESMIVDEGQEPSSLIARETVVRRAWSRVEREQDDREASLSDRRCGGGWDDVDGAVLYAMKLADLEEGGQQGAGPHPGRREQALVWAERQMDRADALREAEALELVGRPRRPADIERSLDHAEKQQHEAAERRRGRVAALSEDERAFVDEELAALDPRQRENPKPSHVDAALDHARARVAALDEEIKRRRADIEQTPGDGYARLLAAGFAKSSRQQKVEALTAMEAVLTEDFDRREERIRSDDEGEAFLRRGRREVLGAAERQPKTLPERGRVIAAAEQERQDREIERRKSNIAKTPGAATAAARLHELGLGKTRQKSLQALTAVETELTADFDRRERTFENDAEGKTFLRDARITVLGTDRAPGTLPERGSVLIKAVDLRTAAWAERRRQAAAQRVARLQKLFDGRGGDEAVFAALDECKPGWRESGTQPADIDAALDLAEQRVDRTQATTAEHEVVVLAERQFREAPSAAWRQTRERFPPAATHARALSGRLADRARARALAAEQTEPPAPSALVQRLFEWLRRQVEELLRRLGLVKAEKPRPIPAPEASMPVPEKSSSAGSSRGAVERTGPVEPSAAASRSGESEVPREAAEDHSDTEDEHQEREEVFQRTLAVRRVPGGADRLHAEAGRILDGEDRLLSREESKSALRTVENWIQQEMHALVEQFVVAEVRTKVGFAAPIPVLRTVGRQLRDEYNPATRPGCLVAALETLPEGIGNLPTDEEEEETLRMALDEKRRTEADQRYKYVLTTYKRDLQIWKKSSGWVRGPGWPRPKPPKPKRTPSSQEDRREFRQALIGELVGFVRDWVNQNFEKRERVRPLRPGEGGARPATTYDPAAKYWQRSGRGGDGQSR